MNELTPATLAFIRQHAHDDVRTLALQSARFPEVEMSEAVCQIAARQTARTKLPTWWRAEEIRYPKHLSMEQCSSEVTARYKASLIPENMTGGNLTDLTGGFGVDFCCMATRMKEATYVEHQSELCALARHNFPLLGLTHAQVVENDATEHLKTMPRQDLIFIDPARRNEHGGKTVKVSDCEPDVAALQELMLEKGGMVMIKLSPMLDITQALQQLTHVRQIHVVAVGGECKELLLILTPEARSEEAEIHCINLSPHKDDKQPAAFCFTQREEAKTECAYTNKPEQYLYEPHAALLKGGAYRTLAARLGLKKLHPSSHLYTNNTLIADFPGRAFEITAYGGFGKKDLKELPRKANLTVRNFPTGVAELRKKLKLAEGGDEYLFATTLNNGEKVWIRGQKANCTENNNQKTTDIC